MDTNEGSDSINRRYLECGGHRGKGIAVLTSGGDSQGMNAAIRAVVRTALYLGCNVFFVREGYQGLVDGDITIATWSSVSSIIQKGGTVIGSARCKEFRTVEGRAKAAKNLIDFGVNNLVVIGGDGSLTGANIFREEWKMHLDNLITNGDVRADSVEDMECLNIVGIVGSIDNDFCGTDMTIGTDSALLRILEAVDAIACTAYSHQRTFIMEVMGRHCGYLAISAGLLCGATAVFLPEDPPEEEWENDLCETIKQEREAGQRLNIIIVAEGALDRSGNPITSEMIKDVVVNRLKHDARISVLGHIQRGGSPSAFDRVLGCRMGAEAVIALLEATPETEAVVITLTGNHSKRLPLMECVEMTKKAAQALVDKKWALAVELRGRTFKRRLEVYKTMHMGEKKKTSFEKRNPHTVAVVHIGAPACGMNSTVRSFVRTALNYNIRVYGITQGIDGLVLGDFHEMKWADVNGWVGEGGALLGTRRTLPRNKMQEIADKFKLFGIQGLFIIGGFEAFLSALMFYDERPNYKEFCIPILVAAATISNNVPGSDCSIGCDTALNVIIEICDRMRQSAQGTKRRVFIVETMGGYCGYLATLAGIAGGADAAYIFEEKFSIKDLHKDLYNMASKMSAGVQRGLILRNERCNENYNCDFMTKLYAEEGKGVFTARSNIIGHMQQGGSSSPFDRSMGITIGIKAVKWFDDILEKNLSCDSSSTETVAVVGLVDKMYQFTSVPELAKTTDFEKRIPKKQWWMKLRPLLRIIAKHETIYEEGTFMFYDAAAIENKNSSLILV